MNTAEQKSVSKAKQILLKHGLIALDGSGEPCIEGLFARLYLLDKENEALKLRIAYLESAILAVPEFFKK